MFLFQGRKVFLFHNDSVSLSVNGYVSFSQWRELVFPKRHCNNFSPFSVKLCSFRQKYPILFKLACSFTKSLQCRLGKKNSYLGQLPWLCLPPNSTLTINIRRLPAGAEFLRQLAVCHMHSVECLDSLSTHAHKPTFPAKPVK